MKFVVFVAAATALVLQNEQFGKRATNAPGFVKAGFDVTRGQAAQKIARPVNYGVNRNDAVAAEIENELIYYSIKLYVGQERAEVEVLLDTGSSDLWVMGLNAECQALVLIGTAKRGTRDDFAVLNGDNRVLEVREQDSQTNSKEQNQILEDKRNLLRVDNDPQLERRASDSSLLSIPEISVSSQTGVVPEATVLSSRASGSVASSLTAVATSDSAVTTSPSAPSYSWDSSLSFWYSVWTPSLTTTDPYSYDSTLSYSAYLYSWSDSYSTSSSLNTPNSCTNLGSYATDFSGSWEAKSPEEEFSIQYMDGTGAYGLWGWDDVLFGSTNLTSVQLAVVNSTSSLFGVLGIGLTEGETTNVVSFYSSARKYQYPNLPKEMVLQGQIPKRAYSLYLNSNDLLLGEILFGGVDHAKYSGPLVTVPMVNIFEESSVNPRRMDIILSGLDIYDGKDRLVVSAKKKFPVILDSGTTFTYLPIAFVKKIVKIMKGVETYSDLGVYIVDCSYRDKDSNFTATFDFLGQSIKVPLRDMVFADDGDCKLGILGLTWRSLGSYPKYGVLGDNFIRNAYVVYDLDNSEISLAQVKYSLDEDIEVISSLVPLATHAASYSETSLAHTHSPDSEASSGGMSLGTRVRAHLNYLGIVFCIAAGLFLF